MTIQSKTTILFTLLTAAVFTILAIVVYYFSNQFAYTDFYKRLELRVHIASKYKFEEDHNTTESFKIIQRQYLERLPDERSHIVALDARSQPEPPFPPDLPKSYLNRIKDAKGETVFYQKGLEHFAGIFYKDETGDFLVIESAVNAYGGEIIRQLGYILIITLVASIIIIYSVGLYFSKKAFQPFRYITERVNAISEGSLHLRLKQQAGTDELAILVDTFNNMLDKLSTAFEAQNNFVSHASHEFRTPLTSIIAEADFALSRDRTAEDYKHSLNNIVQQSEKLQRLTKGLLALAQSGFDGKTQRWEKIRLDELLFRIKETVTDVEPENQVSIFLPDLPEHEDGISVYGNEELLKIALDNIVLNGCKYSGNAPVKIDLMLEDKKATITVIDKGIGIPENEVKYIYDPFFRASNTSRFEGYGIGMPLTRNIIRIHRGSIDVISAENEGTTIKISLPLVS
ncbi:HAMP domain-containing sensor histidine kinase [Niabella ginsengisoli]|uniref:histidine kinase n=1 Tax=Niabella ginsengisoli TaxID=522298 RepID=A0ABS9SPE8_9BACT|nr:HAMP domain-containing sensor histidine kinase [Niabella ginsengisoli]MCH5600240.1 HAMP domain-containing histidine kinase [Niabella ginsengisoli]